MRLLIVDDNKALAEVTAELLACIDQAARQIETITLVSNLESALRHLTEHDTVLCDGEFPVSAGSRFTREEWAVVFREACRHGIHFVLYSGSAICLDDARYCDIPSIAKPASIEKIYAALTEHGTPHPPQQILTSQVVCE